MSRECDSECMNECELAALSAPTTPEEPNSIELAVGHTYLTQITPLTLCSTRDARITMYGPAI